MTDREFLTWLYERLEYVHHENPNVDYMHKLRAIISNTPPDRRTANTVSVPADEAVVALREKLTLRHEEALHGNLAALDRLIAIAGIPRGDTVCICDNCGCIYPDVFKGSRCPTTACCYGRVDGWGKSVSYKIYDLANMFKYIDRARSRRGCNFPSDLPVVMTGAMVPGPGKETSRIAEIDAGQRAKLDARLAGRKSPIPSPESDFPAANDIGEDAVRLPKELDKG